MSLPVILLGAGGHAKVVLNLLQLIKSPLSGVIDPKLKHKGIKEWRGLPVLGEDSDVYKYPPNKVLLANGLGSLPGKNLRQTLFKQFKKSGYTFITLVHPTAIIADGVELAEGVQVMAGCILQTDVLIDENTLINTGTQLDHDCKVGKHCHLAPAVVLSGNVNVGNYCHLGPASCVVQGCHLGQGAVLGAGSTLLYDLPEGHKYLAAKPQQATKHSQ
ncbi:acetyltransferase [Marinospirillum perlucidum]|uniref:acetyltransferase n=1 Tax=Marinospirillum perlucidum TaxID=1982602 RepID=UPI000DF2D2EF|nr:acetyltransferase [Marinospirillum perlucidum]